MTEVESVRRNVYLSEIDLLRKTIAERLGGVLNLDLEGGVYNLYIKEGLTLDAVIDRINLWTADPRLIEEHGYVVAITQEQRINEALRRIWSLAGFDGAQHKDYALNQILHALTGPKYAAWVKDYEFPDGPDGDEYCWETGIAP